MYLKLLAGALLLLFSTSLQLDEEQNEVDKSEITLNFVIFLTEPDVTCAKSINEDKNLFCFKKNILPCTDKYLKGMPKELVRYARLKNVSCDCEKILKNSIKSLLQWAEVNKQMATAYINLQEKSQSQEIVSQPTNKNILREIFPRKRRNFRYKRSIYLMPNSETDNKEDLIYLPLPKDEIEKTDAPILKIINSQDIPVYNTYPKKKGIKFNNINKYDNFIKPSSRNYFDRTDYRRSNNINKNPNGMIHMLRIFKDINNAIAKTEQSTKASCSNNTTELTTSTENDLDSTMSETTEVNDSLDEDDTTTCSTTERDSNDMEEATEESTKDNNEDIKNSPQGNFWDMLQLMDTIKSTYFKGFFQPLWGDVNATEPSLEAITKTMLEQLKDVSGKHGYIAVITGGKLSDLNSTSSELSKTLKSIKHRCNENRTVIIVTGYCPKKKRKKSNGPKGSVEIPLFISGVYSDRFHEVKELYDIPHIIRDILKEEGKKEEETEGDDDKSGLVRFFPNDGEMKLAETLIDETYSEFDEETIPVKFKRSIFTRELENNSETFVLPRLLLSLFCFVIFRTIF